MTGWILGFWILASGLQDTRFGSPEHLRQEAHLLLERGEARGAVACLERALVQLPRHQVLQHDLAVALLARGRQALAAEDYVFAATDFQRAGKLLPEEGIFAYEEAHARYLRGEIPHAQALLQRALRLEETAASHEFLGALEYLQNRHPRAIQELERALQLEPQRASARALLARVQREWTYEAAFKMQRSRHFEIRFDPKGPAAQGFEEIRQMLEKAYPRICQELATHPRGRVEVVMYAAADFPFATETERWVKGLFDGKIRIPVELPLDREELEQTLAHEFAHCVLSAAWPSAPVWLHEGIAQALEPEAADGDAQLRATFAAAESLPDPRQLPRSFLQLQDEQEVRLCYVISLSFVQFLRQRFRSSNLAAFMRAGKRGAPWPEAFEDGYGRSLETVIAEWRRSVFTTR